MDDAFRYEPSAQHPGWMTWELRERDHFNAVFGPFLVRREPDGRARCRVLLEKRHSNLADAIHGGAILAFADMALFAAARALDVPGAGAAVTLDCHAQFLAAGRVDEPLDAVIELLRETRRLAFLRGVMEQPHGAIAAFSGTLRKSLPARADTP